MTKDVMVTVRGLQSTDDRYDSTEIIATGQFFTRNGKYFLLYDEFDEEGQAVAKVKLKIEQDGSRVEMTRKGDLSAQMTFAPGEVSTTSYLTPFGEIEMSVVTKTLSVEYSEDRMVFESEYDLEANGLPVSGNQIRVEVTSVVNAETDL